MSRGRVFTLAVLPAVLLAVLLAVSGCGGSTAEPRSEPASTASPGVTGPPWRQVAIVTGTAAGGQVSTEPTRLDSPAAVDAFVSQFERPGLGDEVRAVLERVTLPEGWIPVGAVVAIGCEAPTRVTVDTRTGFAIVAEKVKMPTRECFAAMTSVAVFGVDELAL
jgi:hypothetical protein